MRVTVVQVFGIDEVIFAFARPALDLTWTRGPGKSVLVVQHASVTLAVCPIKL